MSNRRRYRRRNTGKVRVPTDIIRRIVEIITDEYRGRRGYFPRRPRSRRGRHIDPMGSPRPGYWSSSTWRPYP